MSRLLDRHFTATTFVVGEKGVLLLEHRKLGTWLPPGGHVEKNELPHETALREIKEETGLDVTLLTDPAHRDDKRFFENDERAEIYPPPWKVLLEKIEENHYHIDFIYLARANKNQAVKVEGYEFRWFGQKELENTGLLFPNVKYLALLAIKELQKQK